MIRDQQTPDLEVQDSIPVLELSGLDSRSPIENTARIQRMRVRADLIVTARDEVTGHIVGVAKSLTDFSYCCNVSDLTVDCAYRRKGIGRSLLEYTAEIVGPGCSVVLIAAPEVREFYLRSACLGQRAQSSIAGSYKPFMKEFK